MPTDLQSKTHSIHNGVMVFLAVVFALVFATLTVAPMFFPTQEAAKELTASMKDATINVMLIIIGYVFGSSSSSRTKDLAPEPKKEF